jgi:single-stranded-DNA-specific exonuclease
MGNPDWRPSLLGLVANSLSEEYNKPVFLWGREGKNLIKGSCRSDGITDLVALMNNTEGTFAQFGGHKMAGGFEVFEDAIHTIEETLCCAYRMLPAINGQEEVMLDGALTLMDVSLKTYAVIDAISPFGINNHKPLFLFEHVEIIAMKLFGKQKNHLSVTVVDATGSRAEAIAFFADQDSFGNTLKVGTYINMIAHIEKSVFRGRSELRLRLIDVMEEKS